jgi:hypothetical protein
MLQFFQTEQTVRASLIGPRAINFLLNLVGKDSDFICALCSILLLTICWTPLKSMQYLHLFIHFHSNLYNTETGFKLEYNATSKNPNKIGNCIIVFVSSHCQKPWKYSFLKYTFFEKNGFYQYFLVMQNFPPQKNSISTLL